MDIICESTPSLRRCRKNCEKKKKEKVVTESATILQHTSLKLFVYNTHANVGNATQSTTRNQHRSALTIQWCIGGPAPRYFVSRFRRQIDTYLYRFLLMFWARLSNATAQNGHRSKKKASVFSSALLHRILAESHSSLVARWFSLLRWVRR